jgi:3-hydroxyacyl-[acyl-carrier-protein] dehydratase
VDRIDAVEPGVSIRGAKLAAASEDYFTWHFPERPIVPGNLVLEAVVQLAGWLEAVGSGFERWVLLTRVASARWYAFAGPGDRIDLALDVLPGGDPSLRRYRAETLVRGERGATLELEARGVPLEGLEDPARVRRAYEGLRAAGDAP